jgi:hypothetical protein
MSLTRSHNLLVRVQIPAGHQSTVDCYRLFLAPGFIDRFFRSSRDPQQFLILSSSGIAATLAKEESLRTRKGAKFFAAAVLTK